MLLMFSHFFQSFLSDLRPHDNNSICDIYQAQSKINGAGRGIFAGRSLEADVLIDDCPSILVSASFVRRWKLAYYVCSTDVEHLDRVTLGTCMMFNHMGSNQHNIASRLSNEHKHLSDSHLERTISDYAQYGTTMNVSPGEELFISYGGDEWFHSRSIEVTQLNDTSKINFSHNLNYLQENGICLSNIYNKKSMIPYAGYGIFAKRKFFKNEIIIVSPILALPKNEVIDENGILYNYCYDPSPQNNVLLFPIGLSAMINHQTNSNTQLEWYDTNITFLNTIDINSLLYHHSMSLNIIYRATRDIEINEEITINYGNKWLLNYLQFIDNLNEWKLIRIGNVPRFRHTIDIPEEMSVESWNKNTMKTQSQMGKDDNYREEL